MSEQSDDQYDHYSYDVEKHVPCSHSGKGRTKKEAELRHNQPDPCGHTRKVAQKLINSHENEKASGGHSLDTGSKSRPRHDSDPEKVPLAVNTFFYRISD